jgi:hypothetical protein
MNESNIIVTPENIISTFGVVMDEGLPYATGLAYDNWRKLSKFSLSFYGNHFVIKKKNEAFDCFFTSNFENSTTPFIAVHIIAEISNNGTFTTSVGFNNKIISTLLEVNHRYLKVYNLIHDIKEFNYNEKIDLSFIAFIVSNEVTDELSITSIKHPQLDILDADCEQVEANICCKVDIFLKSLDIEYIDENTDMEKLYPLIEMQRSINHMARI